jgi:mannose-6-phosphate isomerase-like protein (cupin superfamily)
LTSSIDLSRTFVHLRDGGDAEPVRPGRTFWQRSTTEALYDRLVGVFAFSTSADLHASMQEMHPEADEMLYLVSGAVDVLLDEGGAERRIALEAGRATIVPRGVWHRLVVRRPGALLFINSRTAMQSRPYEAASQVGRKCPGRTRGA